MGEKGVGKVLDVGENGAGKVLEFRERRVLERYSR